MNELINSTALTAVFAELVDDADARIAYVRDWNRFMTSRENRSAGAAWREQVDGFTLSCENINLERTRERLLTIVDADGRGHTWELNCVWGDEDAYIHVLDLRESHALAFVA